MAYTCQQNYQPTTTSKSHSLSTGPLMNKIIFLHLNQWPQNCLAWPNCTCRKVSNLHSNFIGKHWLQLLVHSINMDVHGHSIRHLWMQQTWNQKEKNKVVYTMCLHLHLWLSTTFGTWPYTCLGELASVEAHIGPPNGHLLYHGPPNA